LANDIPQDWGEASVPFDSIKEWIGLRDITAESEAQTRFDVIDRVIKEVLGWRHGQIKVEEALDGDHRGFVDYILRAGDFALVIEAKKTGAAFPSPTRKKLLKLSGSVLGAGEIAEAITQAREYAISKDAMVAIASNGVCWVVFAVEDNPKESYAQILFPFENASAAEQLFNLLSAVRVETGSLFIIQASSRSPMKTASYRRLPTQPRESIETILLTTWHLRLMEPFIPMPYLRIHRTSSGVL
jgi:predicted type IV restriction endonuclease